MKAFAKSKSRTNKTKGYSLSHQNGIKEDTNEQASYHPGYNFDMSQISILPPSIRLLQPKLKINTPGDQYEYEADQIADQVMRMPNNSFVQKRSSNGRAELIQQKPLAEQINTVPTHAQRKCTKCEEEEQIQTKAQGQLLQFTNANLSGTIQNSKGGGQVMDSKTQSFMSSRFGTDFSGIRIHTDSTATQMNQEMNARAFTVGNDVYFNKGQYQPDSFSGQRLLAHELVHTLQQRKGPNRIQRDLAIKPQGSGATRGLTKKDIEDAIKFNDKKFKDPYSFKVIRDVIGINQYPAVSDEDLVMGIRNWQTSQGIAQDGKIGVVTLMFILEELQAEGQSKDADLLRKDFRGSTGPKDRKLPDIDTSHCGCEPLLEDEIKQSVEFTKAYQDCGKDPSNKTGNDIESCVNNHFTSKGASISTAGTTSTGSGGSKVKKVKGKCGPLMEQITRAHEQIHGVHVDEMKQIHGRGRTFRDAINDSKDWVADEVNSRDTDRAVAKWMLEVLKDICPKKATTP